MANEVKVLENAVVLDGQQTPNYNKKLGEEVRRIQIKCRRIKTAKNEFNSVKGFMHLPCYDEDGASIGKHNRWLDVHFMKGAFKDTPAECEVHSPDELVTGFLYVKAKYIQAPRSYRVTTDEETGEMKYPTIWIKGGVVGFEAYVQEQDAFDYVEEVRDAEIESGDLVQEESETEETKI